MSATSRWTRSRFTSTTARSVRSSQPSPAAVWIRASVSFGKHEPPYPRPALRNAAPIRGSRPIPFTTWVTSPPASSQRLAISLMKEIFVARNAFDAYLMISAE